MISWKSFIESPDKGYWDQSMLSDLLESNWYADILVTPGHWRADLAHEVNEWLDEIGPALVLISSDEEGECPFWRVKAPVWKMTPNMHLAHRPDRAIPLGYTPHTRPTLFDLGMPLEKKGWTFSGQVTNDRRHSAMEALRGLGEPYETDTFASGLDPETYIKTLWDAEWVPCPAGNVRPETFRMWEALEAGAVPILDATSPHGDQDYWPFVLGDHPFPVVADWSRVGEILSHPAPLTRAAVWYSGFKRKWRRDLWNAWADLIGEEPWVEPTQRITAIVTASPVPSHPGFELLTETVESVRSRLPGIEIIIAFDGPHPDDNKETYEEHIRRVAYHANLYWPEVWVWYTGEWKHQAATVRDILPHVYPDYATLLMLEHDTPLTGDIPFQRLTELLYMGEFDSIRFHHESKIPQEHKYLMHGRWSGADFTIMRTTQYSQRPHMALLSYYRGMMGQLPQGARTYIEDWWYGKVANAPWDHHKQGIYHPRGDIKRSYHLDGRAGGEKREMHW